jgi:hypothetical protein
MILRLICMYFSLLNIVNPHALSIADDIILPPIRNIVLIYKQTAISFFLYQISSTRPAQMKPVRGLFGAKEQRPLKLVPVGTEGGTSR